MGGVDRAAYVALAPAAPRMAGLLGIARSAGFYRDA